jgi:hypothetical protein
MNHDSAFASIKSFNKANNLFSFYLPKSFSLPENLKSCTIVQFQNVLSFASKLLALELDLSDQFIRDAFFSEFMVEVNKKHSQELLNIQQSSISETTSKIAPLISKFTELESKHSETISEIKQEYEQKIKTLHKSKAVLESEVLLTKSELETTYSKEIKNLTKKVSTLEAELQIASTSESLIRERCKQESERIIKTIEEKNREMITLKEDILSQREQKLVQKEQELQSKIQRQASSVLRGHDGETFFKNIAKEKMNWDLEKAPTFSCDYSSTIHNSLTFFEIKNYTNPVPSSEITKFLRDMKLHPEALTGIFVSLNTPINGKDPAIPISLDWINASQCVVYIQSCADLDIDHTLSLIDQVVRVSTLFNNFVSSQASTSLEPIFQARIEQAKSYLERTISRGTKLIKKIMTDKKNQIEFIETSTSHNICELKFQAADITTSIQILLGEYSEPEESEELSETKSEVKPVEKKKKKSNLPA